MIYSYNSKNTYDVKYRVKRISFMPVVQNQEQTDTKTKVVYNSNLFYSEYPNPYPYQTYSNESKSEERDTESEPHEHPWLKYAGIFADDPDWKSFQESVMQYRKERDFETTDTQCLF